MNQLTSNYQPVYAILLKEGVENQANRGMTSQRLYKMGLYLLAFLLLFTLRGISAPIATPEALPVTAPKEIVAGMTNEQKLACIEAMKARVNEIKAMDKSSLTREERKALRTELKQMNKQARTMRREVTGVYISIGALIIIILLLIIIL